ncbi:hypothetical protein JCGZ_13637 [Jatropha curcas]|uniref:Uncharacterized protein n=1 Tax=Jatropha curcas TaxID=180498 RepID=A0A067K9Y3_JATCU|nr:hypothetical protein JCGZ_13637 [Jatropha curcas]
MCTRQPPMPKPIFKRSPKAVSCPKQPPIPKREFKRSLKVLSNLLWSGLNSCDLLWVKHYSKRSPMDASNLLCTKAKSSDRLRQFQG